jgi:flagellar basal body-associated protein FliL
MDMTEAAEPSSADKADKKYLTVLQAAFIGVGAMVGAGIFALLGAARAGAAAESQPGHPGQHLMRGHSRSEASHDCPD